MSVRRALALPALCAVAILLVPGLASAAKTVAPQPPLDISKLDWQPIGFFKPGDAIPATADPPKADANGLFNPSGHFSAYDTNVYESLNFPTRQADDKKADDPLGNGGNPYGFCPQGGAEEGGDPRFVGAGRCFNHQLEYLDHFERTMKAILGDFGVVVHRYQFESPGSTTNAGERSAAGNNAAGTSTAPGRSFNIAAEVPGADNPEESVIVSGHYDFTDSAPAAAWDSSEGHAEVIRMAQMMASYWRATGTRPSATVKFMPWDQEESGTLGSRDFVANNVPPEEQDEIRGYFNVDPCAGAWPAYYHGDGNEDSRVNMTLQVADPASQTAQSDAAEFTTFNQQSENVIDQVFDRIDNETIQSQQGDKPAFVSEAEAGRAGDPDNGKPVDRNHVVTALGGLLLFTSDYANFEGIGVPFMNLSPDMFGPHSDPTTDAPTTSGEGVAILHTPQDSLTTLNRLTGPDQSGSTASDGWMKGMEFCSAAEAWGMLQPNMSGAQTMSSDPVAYYTALPNEAIVDQDVTFDATGSYQYAATGSRQMVPDDQLEYRWDFGDGITDTGRVVKHAYPESSKYQTTLTVVNKASGQSDTMSLLVTVDPSKFVAPILDKPKETNDGGRFPLKWTFEGDRPGLKAFAIEESEDYRTMFNEDAEGPLELRWTANKPEDSRIQPWQKSDSGADKFNGNKAKSGKTSFWTGQQPSDFTPSEVVQGDSILTSKGSIEVPRTGNTTVQYFSLMQLEGDDSGRVEVAIDDDNPATAPDWSPVLTEQGVSQVGGDPDERLCDPSQPVSTATADFHPISVPLDSYRGRKLLVRFVMHLGPENRSATQPCGWYVDDIRVSTGEFIEIGQVNATTLNYLVNAAPTGTDAYRVRGLYNDGVRTGSSNVETVKVTNGGPSRRGAIGVGGPGSSGPNSGAGPAIACAASAGFELAEARVRSNRVRFGFSRRSGASTATVEVQRVAGNRAIGKARRVARFTGRSVAFTWNGRDSRGRKLADGYYVARFSATAAGRTDTRKIPLRLSRGKWQTLRAYASTPRCTSLIRSLAASKPVFGGTRRGPLQVSYRVTRAARVTLRVLRGKKTVRRSRTVRRSANRGYTLRIPVRGLKRGTYRVRIDARAGKSKASRTVTVRRL